MSVADAIRVVDVSKRFGPVVANRGASLTVASGELHALVGENGAGKSTLMRMVCGLETPDQGRIVVFGHGATGWSARAAIDAGVGMVHQHFTLVPTLTVAENVVLGREPVRGPIGIVFDKGAATAAVETVSRTTGLAVDPLRRVAELSVGEAQRVEIIKALARGARLLILDEPTAVLTPPEVGELWAVLRVLRASGTTIVLMTHKLDEVMAISDAVTVMRGGQTVATFQTADTTPALIARSMVGRAVSAVVWGAVPEAAVPPPRPGTALDSIFPTPLVPVSPGPRRVTTPRPVLTVDQLVVSSARVARAVDRVSFEVRAGEILGIAGVEGNGQTELIEALAGLRPAVGGTIRLDDQDITRWSVRQRIAHALAHIPDDRLRRGLVLQYTVAENLILGRQHEFARRSPLAGIVSPTLDRRRMADHARQRIAIFDVRPPDPDAPVRALSGGNQQKVVVAREVGGRFRILLASQPTRGVDVGAIEMIHQRLRAARDAGGAILLVSAELHELLALADRIAVMFRGRIVTVVDSADATVERLGRAMTGAADS